MLNEIITGDCLDYLERLKQLYPTNQIAIISDPPYGENIDCDRTRITCGIAPANIFRPIVGDDKPFNPSPWLDFPEVILWGYNHFAQRLPVGTTLVWNKKPIKARDRMLSDCELAWQKGGVGVYIFEHIWHGFIRDSEMGPTLHPTQKPIALFRWCISRLKLPKGTIIVDPYCGSGPCAVAATELGYDFIGFEIDPDYAAIARKRFNLARAQGRFNFDFEEAI